MEKVSEIVALIGKWFIELLKMFENIQTWLGGLTAEEDVTE